MTKDLIQSSAATIAREFKDFTYRVSHDLNAPVRGMVEFSRLLKAEHKASLNEEGQLYLSLIVDSGVKLQNMMGGLVEYSRLVTEDVVEIPAELSALISDAKKDFADIIKKTDAVIEVGPMPAMKVEPEHMKRLFSILLDNALKFRSPKGNPVVTISAEKFEKNWVFTVQDNGIGISPQFHQKLFNPFIRLHSDEEYPGTGIGLALAKKIVERLGGTIKIVPSPTQETKIQFQLAASSEVSR